MKTILLNAQTILKLRLLRFLHCCPMSTESRPHPTLCSEGSWTYTTVRSRKRWYRIPSKTTFTRCVWHPFCRRSFLAFSLPVSHPGGANWWLVPYKTDLWGSPHHGKIGFLHLPKCSDKEENTLVGSSPSNAKRQSGHWTLGIPAHCQVTTHSLAGHLLQKQ